MNIRVIARLDIKGPNLVKGIHLEGLRVLGKPENFAKHYYETGADELLYMDVVASLYGRNNLLEIVKKTSREIFIPLTVGGGLRTIENIREVLRAGADKVALNTAAIARPEFIKEAAKKFGSSTIVVSIEAMKQSDGSYKAYTDNGREPHAVDVFEWALRVAELGAGEILVTSIDLEGTGLGYDLSLTKKIAESVSIPVIACGGAGEISHVTDVVKKGRADAVCAAAVFHYHYIKEVSSLKEESFKGEGNIEYLKSRRDFKKVKGISIPQVKKELALAGVACRGTP